MQVLCQEFMSTHFRIRYGDIGCQIFPGWVTKIICIDFWPKINIKVLKGNLCILLIDVVKICQNSAKKLTCQK